MRSQFKVHAVAVAGGVGDGGEIGMLPEAGPGQPDHSIDGNVTRIKSVGNIFHLKEDRDF